MMGYSRDSFYRIKELYDTGGELVLKEVSRKKAIPKKPGGRRLKKLLCQMVIDQPALGQFRVANELRKRGIFISPAGVRCVWQRHDMETLPNGCPPLRPRLPRKGSS